MVNHTIGTGIKLSGHWNSSGVVLQIESLPTLLKLESALEKYFHIDCSELNSVGMSELRLLDVWMQCVRLRGVKPELFDLPEGVQQAIKRLDLENCFSETGREPVRTLF